MDAQGLCTQTTPEYYEPSTALDDVEQHKLRVLIDEIATLRGLTIQMSLRVMSLVAAPLADQRAWIGEEFTSLFAQFNSNMDLIFGTLPPQGDMASHIQWIRKTVARNAPREAELRAARAGIERMAMAIKAGQVPSFDEAQTFFNANWPVVRDKMTEIIWDLWADLDAQKNESAKKNDALQKVLQETLSDIKQFSSSIRMIAFNSSILATRPEQAGPGFKVISSEVKQLSENIEMRANRAQETISGFS